MAKKQTYALIAGIIVVILVYFYIATFGERDFLKYLTGGLIAIAAGFVARHYIQRR